MSFLDNHTYPTADELQARVDRILAMPREYKWDARDGFEPDCNELSRRESDECADRAEARETAWREWQA